MCMGACLHSNIIATATVRMTEIDITMMIGITLPAHPRVITTVIVRGTEIGNVGTIGIGIGMMIGGGGARMVMMLMMMAVIMTTIADAMIEMMTAVDVGNVRGLVVSVVVSVMVVIGIVREAGIEVGTGGGGGIRMM